MSVSKNMSRSTNFPSFLRPRLPQTNKVRVYHVSTPPAPCPPLFAPAAGQSEEATTLESHFLTISQPRPKPNHSSEQSPDILVLGIEVLIFTTVKLTTVFVSKADSSGFLTRSTESRSTRTSLAQIVITAFLEFLLKSHQRQTQVPLVLSLFARSQNQYLFPGSIENVTKHVLDDRQLIKWWCRVLDPIARQNPTDASHFTKAHIVVPGCDAGETRAFFPISSRFDSKSEPLWLNAYPVDLLVEDTSLPPRCLIPRLPDDPKSRFLDDLDAQCDENGVWRGIKNLELFWQMMAHRQECSAGRLVGFVWIVFSSTARCVETSATANDETFKRQELNEKQIVPQPESATSSGLTSSCGNCTSAKGPHNPSNPSLDAAGCSSTSATPLLTTVERVGTELPVGDSTTQNNGSAHVALSMHEAQSAANVSFRKTVASDWLGNIVLSAGDYQSLMDELLQLDFAGEDLAIQSSAKWREKAIILAGVTQFGVDVEGALATSAPSVGSGETVQTTVNVLTGVRKKRKATEIEMRSNDYVPKEPSVNILATNLVRKKPKS